MISNNILNHKPFQKPLRIICKTIDSEHNKPIYTMFSKKGRLGIMMVSPFSYTKGMERFYPGIEKSPSLGIDMLYSFLPKSEEKVGTAFIKFAKYLSKAIGCEGRIHLDSNNVWSKTGNPHAFYRKLGFSSTNKKFLKKIDKDIFYGKDGKYKEILAMYLPQKETAPENIFRKLYLLKQQGTKPTLSQRLQAFWERLLP